MFRANGPVSWSRKNISSVSTCNNDRLHKLYSHNICDVNSWLDLCHSHVGYISLVLHSNVLLICTLNTRLVINMPCLFSAQKKTGKWVVVKKCKLAKGSYFFWFAWTTVTLLIYLHSVQALLFWKAMGIMMVLKLWEDKFRMKRRGKEMKFGENEC